MKTLKFGVLVSMLSLIFMQAMGQTYTVSLIGPSTVYLNETNRYTVEWKLNGVVSSPPTIGDWEWTAVKGTVVDASTHAYVDVKWTATGSGSVSGEILTNQNGQFYPTANVTVQGCTAETPAAGPDQNICGTTATLAANSVLRHPGAWSIVSGPNTSVSQFSSTSDAAATFTATTTGTYNLRWTITTCGLNDTDDVTLNFSAPPAAASAGTDQTISATCGTTSTTLAATPLTVGTGQWTIVSGTGGTITEPASPTSSFSGNAGTSYTLRWTASPGGGCAQTYDDVVINFSAIQAFSVSGGGSLCAGGAPVTITLGGSATGIKYQLRSGAADIETAKDGTGSALTWTTSTAGTYTVVAYKADNANCTVSMTGSAIVTVNPLPTQFTVSGGGTMCSGGTPLAISLSGSEVGINYYLKRPGNTSVPKPGTGAALTWNSSTAATYTVLATNPSTGCSATMIGSADIIVNSLPSAHAVGGGGSYCSGGTGVSVTLSASATVTTYQLMNGGVNVGTPKTGTGGFLTWPNITGAGTYTVVATNIATGCTRTMIGSTTVTVNPLPVDQAVIGGGASCTPGGVSVGISSSESGVSYQLKLNGTNTGSAIVGTGAALSWTGLSAVGTYSVLATNTTTLCALTLTTTASIYSTAPFADFAVQGGGTMCEGGNGFDIELTDSETGKNYQLRLNGSNVGSPIAGTGDPLVWDDQLASGTYTVMAIDAATTCVQQMSGSANITVNPVPPSPLDFAGSGISSTQILLTWQDGSNETSYEIESSANSIDGFTLIQTLAENTTTYTDSQLAEFTQRYYRIRAVNPNCQSAYVTINANSLIAEPSGLGSSSITSNSITLNWSDNTDHEIGYQIERSTNSSSGFSVVATDAENEITHTDVGLAPNTTYYYRIRAIGPDVLSLYSNVHSATTTGPPANGPTNLTSTAVGYTGVLLTWTDNSSNEERFEIERSLSAGTGFSVVATTIPNAISYEDVNLNSGSTYFYRVRAVNSSGPSDPSNETMIRLPIQGTEDDCAAIFCDGDGGIGIGTPIVPENFRLAVNGKVIAEGVKVQTSSAWPDYVFEDNYKLREIAEMKEYIEQHGHLPELPSADQIKKDGVDVAEINVLLLKKIEEMSLYLIKMEERIKTLEEENAKFKAEPAKGQ